MLASDVPYEDCSIIADDRQHSPSPPAPLPRCGRGELLSCRSPLSRSVGEGPGVRAKKSFTDKSESRQVNIDSAPKIVYTGVVIVR